MQVQFNTRIEVELAITLEKFSKETGIPKSKITENALKNYIDEYYKRDAQTDSLFTQEDVDYVNQDLKPKVARGKDGKFQKKGRN